MSALCREQKEDITGMRHKKVYEKDKKRRKIESVVDCTCRPSQSFGRPLKQTADCPEMALVGK
jgi:hypothetical protein